MLNQLLMGVQVRAAISPLWLDGHDDRWCEKFEGRGCTATLIGAVKFAPASKPTASNQFLIRKDFD